MKTLFIPTKANISIDGKNIEEISKKLPKNIAIAYSIQYEDTALKAREILSKNHNITKFIQVLGCSKPNLSSDTEALLLISSGKFHAVSLAIEMNLPIYIIEDNRLMELSGKEIKSFKKRQKAAYMNFLNSDKIGIIISIKPGQENLKKALNLRKTLNSTNKNSYLFIGNEVNSQEFENFHSVQSWINTACPRLDMEDTSIINIADLNINL